MISHEVPLLLVYILCQ